MVKVLRRVRALLAGADDAPLRAAVAELQQAAAHWKGEAQRRRERLTKYERWHDERTRDLERTRAELDGRTADLERTRTELDALNAAIASAPGPTETPEYRTLADEAASLRTTVEQMDAERQAAAAQHTALTTHLQRREQKHQKLIERYGRLEQQFAQVKAEREAAATHTALTDHLQQREQKHQKLIERYERLAQQLAQVKVGREAEREAGASRLTALADQVHQREQKYQKLIERYERLAQQLAQVTAGREAEREAGATRLTALTDHLERREQKHQKHIERYGRLEQQLAQVKDDCEAGVSRLAALADQLHQREQKHQKLLERYGRLEQQFAHVKAEREAGATRLAETLDRVQADRDALASQVAVLLQKGEDRERRHLKVMGRYQALAQQLPQVLRFQLSEEPVRHLLPRRRAAGVPASWREAADQRATSFAAVSSDYHHLEGGDFSQVPMNAVDIDGLTWWFPSNPQDRPHQERMVASRGLDLDGILQTRELGIGGVMIDIGANIGRTAIPRALLGDAQVVYAAEPEPANYACLVRNVVENNLRGVVLPDRVAIGSRNGRVRLDCRPTFSSHHDQPADWPHRQPIDVPCYTMDTWIERLGVDPQAIRFVKVDTNGYELDVLRGATRLLAMRSAAWQVEIAPECLREFGSGLTMMAEELSNHFTHFVDLSKYAPGPRIRSVADMPAALEYLATIPRTGKAPMTDLLLYAAR